MMAHNPAIVWAKSPGDAPALEGAVRSHLELGHDVNLLASHADSRVRVCRVLKKAGGWLVVPGYRHGLGRPVDADTAARLASAEIDHTFAHLS